MMTLMIVIIFDDDDDYDDKGEHWGVSILWCSPYFHNGRSLPSASTHWWRRDHCSICLNPNLKSPAHHNSCHDGFLEHHNDNGDDGDLDNWDDNEKKNVLAFARILLSLPFATWVFLSESFFWHFCLEICGREYDLANSFYFLKYLWDPWRWRWWRMWQCFFDCWNTGWFFMCEFLYLCD